VTPRFCAVDSNSSRHGRGIGADLKKKGERKKEEPRWVAGEGGGRGRRGRLARARERERERWGGGGEGKGGGRERAEQSGKTGITIECKSLDKRPGIVKTRSARGSILILYVASQGRAQSDKGQKSTRVAVFNSDDDCRHSSGAVAQPGLFIIGILARSLYRGFRRGSFAEKDRPLRKKS